MEEVHVDHLKNSEESGAEQPTSVETASSPDSTSNSQSMTRGLLNEFIKKSGAFIVLFRNPPDDFDEAKSAIIESWENLKTMLLKIDQLVSEECQKNISSAKSTLEDLLQNQLSSKAMFDEIDITFAETTIELLTNVKKGIAESNQQTNNTRSTANVNSAYESVSANISKSQTHYKVAGTDPARALAEAIKGSAFEKSSSFRQANSLPAKPEMTPELRARLEKLERLHLERLARLQEQLGENNPNQVVPDDLEQMNETDEQKVMEDSSQNDMNSDTMRDLPTESPTQTDEKLILMDAYDASTDTASPSTNNMPANIPLVDPLLKKIRNLTDRKQIPSTIEDKQREDNLPPADSFEKEEAPPVAPQNDNRDVLRASEVENLIGSSEPPKAVTQPAQVMHVPEEYQTPIDVLISNLALCSKQGHTNAMLPSDDIAPIFLKFLITISNFLGSSGNPSNLDFQSVAAFASPNGSPITPKDAVQLPLIMLIPLNNPSQWRILPLSENYLLGRLSTNNTKQNFMGFSNQVVSRYHLDVWCDNGAFFVKDIGSNSGTFLNGARLSAAGKESEPFQVVSGDVLQLGVDYKPKDGEKVGDPKHKSVQLILLTKPAGMDKPIYTKAKRALVGDLSPLHELEEQKKSIGKQLQEQQKKLEQQLMSSYPSKTVEKVNSTNSINAASERGSASSLPRNKSSNNMEPVANTVVTEEKKNKAASSASLGGANIGGGESGDLAAKSKEGSPDLRVTTDGTDNNLKQGSANLDSKEDFKTRLAKNLSAIPNIGANGKKQSNISMGGSGTPVLATQPSNLQSPAKQAQPETKYNYSLSGEKETYTIISPIAAFNSSTKSPFNGKISLIHKGQDRFYADFKQYPIRKSVQIFVSQNMSAPLYEISIIPESTSGNGVKSFKLVECRTGEIQCTLYRDSTMRWLIKPSFIASKYQEVMIQNFTQKIAPTGLGPRLLPSMSKAESMGSGLEAKFGKEPPTFSLAGDFKVGTFLYVLRMADSREQKMVGKCLKNYPSPPTSSKSGNGTGFDIELDDLGYSDLLLMITLFAFGYSP